jgi:thiamine-phosphate pyrophosphorylase
VNLPSDLYVILDRAASRGRDLRDVFEAVIAGGCRLVQLREKEWSTRQFLALARALGDRARAAGVTFIVNDRADVALAVNADGLHVGQDDLPAPVARRLLRPEMILGVSIHSVEQARQAQAEGADYIAVGSIYPTGTKPAFELVGLDLLRRVRPLIRVPLVAIGGITLENAAAVVKAGADAVAVISAVCGAPEPEEATRRFLHELRAARIG